MTGFERPGSLVPKELQKGMLLPTGIMHLSKGVVRYRERGWRRPRGFRWQPRTWMGAAQARLGGGSRGIEHLAQPGQAALPHVLDPLPHTQESRVCPVALWSPKQKGWAGCTLFPRGLRAEGTFCSAAPDGGREVSCGVAFALRQLRASRAAPRALCLPSERHQPWPAGGLDAFQGDSCLSRG